MGSKLGRSRQARANSATAIDKDGGLSEGDPRAAEGRIRPQMTRRGLRIGGRLDRYVGWLFVSSYATAFLLVVGLFVILDMASNLDAYVEAWPGGGHAPSFLIIRYYLLDIPFLFLQIAPFVTLVAGLFTVSKLLRVNETVAALAAGVSSWRLLAPVFLLGALCGFGMFGLSEVASRSLADRRDALRYVLDNKRYD